MKIPIFAKDILSRFVETKIGLVAMKLGIIAFAPRHRIGISVVCIDQAGDILLLKHLFHPLSPWGFPGGWMDRGEDPEKCGRRELMEETGLEANIDGVVSVIHNQNPHHINIIYRAKVIETAPDLQLQTGEILEGKWFSPHNLPLPLRIDTLETLRSVWKEAGINFEFEPEDVIQHTF